MRLGITTRTLHRWLSAPHLSFPKPILINGRRYWKSGDIEMWIKSNLQKAAA